MGKYFTLDQARTMLPDIRRRMETAIGLSTRMEGMSSQVRELSEKAVNNTGSPIGTAYCEALLALRHCITEIQDAGCLVKSVQEGLVDFPHWREGREVYLCWRYGEDDIEYWHEVEDGFAGRRPISE